MDIGLVERLLALQVERRGGAPQPLLRELVIFLQPFRGELELPRLGLQPRLQCGDLGLDARLLLAQQMDLAFVCLDCGGELVVLLPHHCLDAAVALPLEGRGKFERSRARLLSLEPGPAHLQGLSRRREDCDTFLGGSDLRVGGA
jgi:hypothetical protein